MKVVNLASAKSVSEGYEYYKNGKVLSYEQIGDGVYSGKVIDEDSKTYDVILDVQHPRSTNCNCPFANGRRIVCKHAVALYFTVFPDDATAYVTELEQEDNEYKEWMENRIRLGYYDI